MNKADCQIVGRLRLIFNNAKRNNLIYHKATYNPRVEEESGRYFLVCKNDAGDAFLNVERLEFSPDTEAELNFVKDQALRAHEDDLQFRRDVARAEDKEKDPNLSLGHMLTIVLSVVLGFLVLKFFHVI